MAITALPSMANVANDSHFDDENQQTVNANEENDDEESVQITVKINKLTFFFSQYFSRSFFL